MNQRKTDREKLAKGVKLMAIGFPFILAGPIVLTIAFRSEGMWLYALAIVLILTAFFFCIRGLVTILSAFFD